MNPQALPFVLFPLVLGFAVVAGVSRRRSRLHLDRIRMMHQRLLDS